MLFSDGNNKTGLFLAVANLIEQTNCEGTIEIFSTVKDLRSFRPALLSNAVSFRIQATKNVNKTFQNVLFWLKKKRFVLMYLKRSFNVFAETKPSKNMFISSFQINVFVQCF